VKTVGVIVVLLALSLPLAVACSAEAQTGLLQEQVFAAVDDPECDEVVNVPAGRHVLDQPLVPTGRFGVARCPLVLDGAGQGSTVLTHQTLDGFRYNGLLGYGWPNNPARPEITQVTVTDLTLDGGYQGAGCGGTNPYLGEVPGQAALVSLAQPHTDAWNVQRPTGVHHVFRRVTFQCATGYGFQPANDVTIEDSTFDRMGTPDVPWDNVRPNFDIIGSGSDGSVIVRRNRYTNSSGNYIDLEGSGATPVRAVFVDNESVNHRIGGVYAAGVESLILRNRLRNRLRGSYIGKDGMTRECARNIIAFNTTDRIVFSPCSGDTTAQNRQAIP
jgi:hypothetical protein